MTPSERGAPRGGTQPVHSSGPTLKPEHAELQLHDWLPAPEEIARMLPKILKGSVHKQRVTCGKPGCRCSRGHLHGPYLYLFWREKGRLRKRYTRHSDLVDVLTAVSTYRLEKQRVREARSILSLARESLRDAESVIRKERKGL